MAFAGFRCAFPKKCGERKKVCVVLTLFKWGNEPGARGVGGMYTRYYQKDAMPAVLCISFWGVFF